MTRKLEADRMWTAPNGAQFTLPGRALLFVRNVGHLMTTPAVQARRRLRSAGRFARCA